jgi:hypothetical protein
MTGDPRPRFRVLRPEDVTELLAFGGDSVFEPAGHEWMWRVGHLPPWHVDRARELADSALSEQPDSPGLWYCQALIAAAEQPPHDVREWLAKAIRRVAERREEARSERPLANIADEAVS